MECYGSFTLVESKTEADTDSMKLYCPRVWVSEDFNTVSYISFSVSVSVSGSVSVNTPLLHRIVSDVVSHSVSVGVNEPLHYCLFEFSLTSVF